ncbi:hypothetical protein [Lacimicrobium sp. SS2-24]|uniref:hypothetical protein n=1 Tax=Lacimicrobium sp. SS2-24 TaxID=2005569 RepID=UPI000B4ABF25|nr:hypothetical protein [Lacimicrobium sp. SS2-24]
MKSILKKTLIAAAVASAASANAANITGTTSGVDTDVDWQLVSAEGLAIAETITLGSGAGEIGVNFETEKSYNENDVLLLTFAGAEIDSVDEAALEAVLTDGIGSFDVLEVGTNSITLRPVDDNGVTATDFGILEGITLKAFDGAVTLASVGQTLQGFDIDSGTATPIAQAVSEFDVSVATALDATIDVEEERKQFLSGTTDAFSITVTQEADLLGVTGSSVALDVTAASTMDFLLDGDGELSSDYYTVTGVTETADSALSGTTLSVESSDFAGTFGITFDSLGSADEDANQLVAQSFSGDLTVNYALGGTTGSVDASGLSLGAWDLSGATVNIPYMPYGSGISQIIYVSNDGSVTGDIELTAFDDAGNEYGPVMLDTAAEANKITALSSSIRLALEAEGYDGSSKKMDITLVINSPSGQIEVFSAYNVRGDRLYTPVQ